MDQKRVRRCSRGYEWTERFRWLSKRSYGQNDVLASQSWHEISTGARGCHQVGVRSRVTRMDDGSEFGRFLLRPMCRTIDIVVRVAQCAHPQRSRCKMSCDWYIQCLTCDEKMHFDSSNHAEEAMHEIIAMTQAIALPLNGDFTLVHYRVGTIDVAWLKEHGTHKL